MTPSRPYLIRAFYEWIVDNGMTPHLLVNADEQDTSIPSELVGDDGNVVFNVSHSATRELRVGNDAVEFKTRCGSVITFIYLPIPSIMAIYSRESNKGMYFSEDDIENYEKPSQINNDTKKKQSISNKKTKLKLVK